MKSGNVQNFLDSNPLEPLLFTPLLKSKLWGGRRLSTMFGHDESDGEPVGEAWLMSNYENSETVIRSGSFRGQTLSSLIKIYGKRLMGRNLYERFGHRFPLLIKLIDTYRDLSVQVHPTDRVAHALNLPSGKTEMWYILDAKPKASIIMGFKEKVTPCNLEKYIADDTLCRYLNSQSVTSGDCFLIPAGLIHSIGPGILLLEIQQSSDATFRVYDFNRRDASGQLRDLHIPQAKKALDFSLHDSSHAPYEIVDNAPVLLQRTPFFTTRLYRITDDYALDLSADRFVAIIAIEGEGILTSGSWQHALRPGDVVLLPAELHDAVVAPSGDAFRFVETYVE